MMPDIKLLKFSSSEAAFLPEGEQQTVCSSRRRSCALVNTPTLCVNKVVFHIQELQSKLDNWGQQGDNAQHETAHENSHRIIWKCVSTEGGNAETSTDLCVEGMGLNARESGMWTDTADVLMDVMSLVERLEQDRRDAEKAILEEKEKAKKLLEKLNSLCVWKQNEFPVEMKKEREACSTDLAELTLQLKMSRDQLPQVRDRLTLAEVLNPRLKEEIDFMRKHGPLAHHRLQLEREIIQQIQTALAEAYETFSDISEKLQSLYQELKAEEMNADIEKEHMNKEMEIIRNHISDKQSELQQLQSQCETFHMEMKEIVEKITLKDEQIKPLVKEMRQFERQDRDVNDQVGTLKAQMADKEEMLKLKNNEVMQLQKQIQAYKLESNEKMSELDAVLSQKRFDLSALRDQNKELEFKIEDYKRKTYQSKQAVRKLAMDHEHIKLKISLSEKQWKPVKEELQQVSNEHSDTKAELERLERQTFLEELRNRKEIDKMKSLVSTEKAAFDFIKGNLDVEAAEYIREQNNCKRVKDELQKNHNDAFIATAELVTELEKLTQILTEKSETIENLKVKLSDLQAANKNLSDYFEERKKHHQESLDSAKERLTLLLLRYDENSNRMKEIDLKSKDLKQESEMMEQTISTMPDIIEDLQALSNTMMSKHGTAAEVMGNLHRDMASCEQRKSDHAQIHLALFTQRQAVMKDTEANLRKALKDNLKLAQEYQELQRALMMSRQDVLCVFDGRNRAEASILDHKQLSLLQKRMHKAMLKYFKHRSVYSQAELARFQTLSNQNNQKMKALQVNNRTDSDHLRIVDNTQDIDEQIKAKACSA
ncbi:coiled-coil domain-containing protein 178 isoform X2 [Danio rerio]|uniref:Coiled-coil domain-containing protein 178 isoform X2 n=1 Tax=Danio rerio TaxID=7955 RepID=A0AC58ISH4_DANRE